MAVKQATNLKAVCERDALVEALGLITGVVAGRTPTPALQCVKVSGQDGRLTMAATDGEISLTLLDDDSIRELNQYYERRRQTPHPNF